jgi:hypothetical protein
MDGAPQTTTCFPQSIYDRGYAATREEAMADFKTAWERQYLGAIRPKYTFNSVTTALIGGRNQQVFIRRADITR